MKLGQGAEAVVTREGNTVLKNRIPKNYRHKELDAELRRSRSRRERRILEKVAKLIPVPRVIAGDDKTVTLEYIEGPQVKELLDRKPDLAEEIGRLIAILHKNNIIHGDLTTSNMILRNKSVSAAEHPGGGNPHSATATTCRCTTVSSVAGDALTDSEIVLIDFGLSFTSHKPEDKAVDIHLFRQALESRHHKVYEQAYRIFIKNYKKTYGDDAEAIIERLKKVEGRGRNKAKMVNDAGE